MSSMQRYMEQLIEDIQESAKNRDQHMQEIPPGVYNVPEHLAHLPVIPARKAYQWFNLSLDAFPDADKWNEYQLLYMCVILRSLFEHYHINVELPNDLPYDRVYAYLLKALDTYTTVEPDGSNLISFCSGDPETCPFSDYCYKEDTGHCDTWTIGYHWDAYIELEEMKKEMDAQRKKDDGGAVGDNT